MSLPFIDTNIFIRHLMADDAVQSPACLALFQAIERGEIIVWTTHLVVAEIVFVLTRVYKIQRGSVRDILLPLLSLSGIKLEQKQLFGRVFELFASLSIDYVDCYHAALLESRGHDQLYSFDADFDRVPGIQRLEPAISAD